MLSVFLEPVAHTLTVYLTHLTVPSNWVFDRLACLPPIHSACIFVLLFASASVAPDLSQPLLQYLYILTSYLLLPGVLLGALYHIFNTSAKLMGDKVYNQNFKKYLRDEIYKRQLAYQRSDTKEKKLYIITGTGQGRPGPNFRLQNAVKDLLQENYFRSRIAYYRLEKDGLFAIFLRKNKQITPPQGQNRKRAA